MIAPFKISVDTIRQFSARGNDIKLSELKESFYSNLVRFARGVNNELDGTKLQENCFPIQGPYDVFISHSHEDESDALLLAKILGCFGFRCFVDGCLWGSADKLLGKIDDDYCKNKEHSYDYHKRNFSTSHVHVMLSVALLEAIDQSDFFIFVDSNHTIRLKEGIENETLSPWIYEELAFANRIRTSSENLKLFSKGGVLNEGLQIAYSIRGLVNFKTIIADDIRRWIAQKMKKDAIFDDLMSKYRPLH